jgi:hypothetical protein
MSLDIRNDDYLVLTETGKEYPIREAAFWPYGQAYPSAILNDATVECSTKRKASQTSAGKRATEPATQESDLLCTPLYPDRSNTFPRPELNTPMSLLVTYIPTDDGYYELKVEDLKR